MKKAIYAGSFDPLTHGHLWMIEEGCALFDTLVVAIGINPDKRYTFSLEDRLLMLQEATAHLPVVIETFENQYLVDYAEKCGAESILRGIRSAQDYEFERTMRHINGDLHPDIQTVFLMPPRHLAEISSTLVKGLVGPVGWEAIVQNYVPKAVFEKLSAHTT